MKSKTKVILVGEEHSDTSHMQPIAELVIKHLQNNKSVTIALEQNCGSRTMEDLFYTSIPPSRARYKGYWTDFSRQIFTNFASLFIRRF